MGNTNKIIQAVGISTAVMLSNVAMAAAEEITASVNQQNLEQSSNSQSPVSFSASVLPKSVGIDKNQGKYSQPSVKPMQLSQSTSSQPQIAEPSQEPIPDAQELNPNANPLSFPTQPEEVEVDEQQPISLEQAIELAVKNNREIQTSRLTVQRNREELREAKAALYPNLDSNITYQNSDDDAVSVNPFTGIEVPGEGAANQVNADVSLTYDIYAGGRRGADIRRARKELKVSELDLETQVEQTRFDAAFAYYQLQRRDSEVNIENAAIEDAQQTLKDAQLLEQAGLGTRFDVLRAEVELARAQQRLSTALAFQNTARRDLARTLSLGQKVALKTADAIAEAGTWELSLAETIVQAYKNRAELERFLLQREISDENKKIALSAIIPNVGAFAQYSFDEEFDDEIDSTNGYAVGARLQWQIYDGGAARAQARQAETDKKIAETGFANQRQEIRFDVEQAYFNLQSTKQNIGTATKSVELAEESLRLARLRFQAGVGTQTEVIDAQTELTGARGDLLTAIIEYNQSYVQLQRAVTNLPDGRLQDLP